MDVKPYIGVYVVFDYITILVPGQKYPMYRKCFCRFLELCDIPWMSYKLKAPISRGFERCMLLYLKHNCFLAETKGFPRHYRACGAVLTILPRTLAKSTPCRTLQLRCERFVHTSLSE